MSELLKVASVTESSVVKSDTLFSRFNILFIFQEKKLSNIEMEQNNKDMMPTIKSENENSKMDIEGTVIKLELKPPLTQIHKPNVGLENTNKKGQSVEIKHENQTDDHEQNRIALTIREAICYCTIIVRDAKVLQHPEGVISSQGAKPRGMK